jgi:hypothetical protein
MIGLHKSKELHLQSFFFSAGVMVPRGSVGDMVPKGLGEKDICSYEHFVRDHMHCVFVRDNDSIRAWLLIVKCSEGI